TESDHIIDHKDEFSAEKYAAFIKENSREYGTEITAGYDLGDIESGIDNALKFYQDAKARDNAMLANTVKRMREEGKKTAALITGGYHTEGLTGLMKEKKLSYLVIVPKFESGEERPYIAVLTNKKKPYEKLLESGRYKLAVAAYLYDYKGDLTGIKSMVFHALGEAMIDGQDVEKIKREWTALYRTAHDGLSSEKREEMDFTPPTPDEFAAYLNGINIRKINDGSAVIEDLTSGTDKGVFVSIVRKRDTSGAEHYDFNPASKDERERFLRRKGEESEFRDVLQELKKEVAGVKELKDELSEITKKLGEVIRKEEGQETLWTLSSDAELIKKIFDKIHSANRDITAKEIVRTLRTLGQNVPQNWEQEPAIKEEIERMVVKVKEESGLSAEKKIDVQKPEEMIAVEREKPVEEITVKKVQAEITETQKELPVAKPADVLKKEDGAALVRVIAIVAGLTAGFLAVWSFFGIVPAIMLPQILLGTSILAIRIVGKKTGLAQDPRISRIVHKPAYPYIGVFLILTGLFIGFSRDFVSTEISAPVKIEAKTPLVAEAPLVQYRISKVRAGTLEKDVKAEDGIFDLLEAVRTSYFSGIEEDIIKFKTEQGLPIYSGSGTNPYILKTEADTRTRKFVLKETNASKYMPDRRMDDLSDAFDQTIKKIDPKNIPSYIAKQPEEIRNALLLVWAFDRETYDYLAGRDIIIKSRDLGRAWGVSTGNRYRGLVSEGKRGALIIVNPNPNTIKVASAIVHEAVHHQLWPKNIKEAVIESLKGIREMWALLWSKMPYSEKPSFEKQNMFLLNVAGLDVDWEGVGLGYNETKIEKIAFSIVAALSLAFLVVLPLGLKVLIWNYLGRLKTRIQTNIRKEKVSTGPRKEISPKEEPEGIIPLITTMSLLSASLFGAISLPLAFLGAVGVFAPYLVYKYAVLHSILRTQLNNKAMSDTERVMLKNRCRDILGEGYNVEVIGDTEWLYDGMDYAATVEGTIFVRERTAKAPKEALVSVLMHEKAEANLNKAPPGTLTAFLFNNETGANIGEAYHTIRYLIKTLITPSAVNQVISLKKTLQKEDETGMFTDEWLSSLKETAVTNTMKKGAVTAEQVHFEYAQYLRNIIVLRMSGIRDDLLGGINNPDSPAGFLLEENTRKLSVKLRMLERYEGDFDPEVLRLTGKDLAGKIAQINEYNLPVTADTIFINDRGLLEIAVAAEIKDMSVRDITEAELAELSKGIKQNALWQVMVPIAEKELASYEFGEKTSELLRGIVEKYIDERIERDIPYDMTESFVSEVINDDETRFPADVSGEREEIKKAAINIIGKINEDALQKPAISKNLQEIEKLTSLIALLKALEFGGEEDAALVEISSFIESLRTGELAAYLGELSEKETEWFNELTGKMLNNPVTQRSAVERLYALSRKNEDALNIAFRIINSDPVYKDQGLALKSLITEARVRYEDNKAGIEDIKDLAEVYANKPTGVNLDALDKAVTEQKYNPLLTDEQKLLEKDPDGYLLKFMDKETIEKVGKLKSKDARSKMSEEELRKMRSLYSALKVAFPKSRALSRILPFTPMDFVENIASRFISVSTLRKIPVINTINPKYVYVALVVIFVPLLLIISSSYASAATSGQTGTTGDDGLMHDTGLDITALSAYDLDAVDMTGQLIMPDVVKETITLAELAKEAAGGRRLTVPLNASNEFLKALVESQSTLEAFYADPDANGDALVEVFKTFRMGNKSYMQVNPHIERALGKIEAEFAHSGNVLYQMHGGLADNMQRLLEKQRAGEELNESDRRALEAIDELRGVMKGFVDTSRVKSWADKQTEIDRLAAEQAGIESESQRVRESEQAEIDRQAAIDKQAEIESEGQRVRVSDKAA
ncbi:MAG: hypothetical protein ABH862_05020, partial [Candidatus Omnitrophota bacterium]